MQPISYCRKTCTFPSLLSHFWKHILQEKVTLDRKKVMSKMEGLLMLVLLLRKQSFLCASSLMLFSFCLSDKPILQWLVENSLNVQKCQGRRFAASDCQGLHLHCLNQFSHMIKALLEMLKCRENQSPNSLPSNIYTQVPKH